MIWASHTAGDPLGLNILLHYEYAIAETMYEYPQRHAYIMFLNQLTVSSAINYHMLPLILSQCYLTLDRFFSYLYNSHTQWSATQQNMKV